MSKKAIAGVDNTARRTWDKDEYADKAAERDSKEKDLEENPMDGKKRRRLERDPLHQGLIVERANLKARDYRLDLTARLGKAQMVSAGTPLSQQAGYYCSVCDCVLKDSQSWLDHVNGKWHNRALGMSMRVERSTADQVRKRFELHKAKKDGGKPEDFVADGFDRITLEKEEQKLKEEKRRKREEKQEEADEDSEDEEENEMALAMGFAGFGTSKR